MVLERKSKAAVVCFLSDVVVAQVWAGDRKDGGWGRNIRQLPIGEMFSKAL